MLTKKTKMKKNYFLLIVMFLGISLSGFVNAQTANQYDFITQTRTYSPIVGGTSVPSLSADDVLSDTLPIGFDFVFEGTTYTHIKASSNGFLTFNSSATSSVSFNSSSNRNSLKPALAPLWDDLDGRQPNSDVSYTVSGAVPFRVFTIEWTKFEWNYSSSSEDISFQVKLYESSNKIEFLYKDENGSINSPSATIGIFGGSNYLTLSNSSSNPTAGTSFTSSISSAPATGQVYVFRIPDECFTPNNLSFSGITINSANVNWNSPTKKWYFDYEYGPRGFTPGTGVTDSTRGNAISLAGLTPGTEYDFYIRNYCNLLDSSVVLGPERFTTLTSCFVPITLSDSAVTSTSAYLKWNDTNSTTLSSWIVSYDTAGFNPDSGTHIMTSTNPLALSGLLSSTTYDWYVKSACAIGDSSKWSAKGSFTTDCPDFMAPFIEGFESFAPNTRSLMGDCWSSSPSNTTSATRWNVKANGGTPSSSTGPSGAQGGSNYLYLETSNGSTGDVAEVLSPNVNISSLTSPILTFYTHLYGSSMDTLRVEVSSGGVWTEEFKIGGQQQTSSSDSWTEQTVSLSGYTGIIRVRFLGTKGSSYTGDMSIDEIKIISTPNCFAPSAISATNVTGSSADLSWTDNNTNAPGSWQVSYGPVGFTPGTGTQVTAGTNPFSLTGLMGSTTYEWYVRASCTPGDTSIWSSAGSFTTECPSVSLFPYTEDFDGSLTNGVWDCWSVLNIDGGVTWRQGNTYITPTHSTPYAAYGSGNNDDYLITPNLSLGSGSYRIKFWDKVESSSYPNIYMVLVSTTGKSASDFTDTLTTITTTNTSWLEHTVNLTGYANQNIYVAFHQISSRSAYWGFGIDDFSVNEIPTCPAGGAISGYNPTTTSHDVTWTPGLLDVSWELEYGAPGFTPGTGTLITGVSNDSATISGLISNTSYDVYYRSICAAGDTGAFVGPVTIQTDAFPIAYDTTVISACYSFTTPLGGKTHTVSNIYYDTVKGSVPHQYDSAIHVYDVTVNKLKTGLLVFSSCDGVITASGKSYTVTGVYLDSLPSAAGCDSITTIDLTITYTEYYRDTVVGCDSNIFRGKTLTTSGVYYDTLNTGACDKIFIRNLTLGYTSYESFTHFVCDSFVSPTGKVWDTTGTYLDTLVNASG